MNKEAKVLQHKSQVQWLKYTELSNYRKVHNNAMEWREPDLSYHLNLNYSYKSG